MWASRAMENNDRRPRKTSSLGGYSPHSEGMEEERKGKKKIEKKKEREREAKLIAMLFAAPESFVRAKITESYCVSAAFITLFAAGTHVYLARPSSLRPAASFFTRSDNNLSFHGTVEHSAPPPSSSAPRCPSLVSSSSLLSFTSASLQLRNINRIPKRRARNRRAPFVIVTRRIAALGNSQRCPESLLPSSSRVSRSPFRRNTTLISDFRD